MKNYKLTLKNYILVTLLVIAIVLLLCECNNITTLLITKITSITYFALFTYANIIKTN